MAWALLALSVTLGAAKNALSKAGGEAFSGPRRLHLVNLIIGVTAAAVFAVLARFSFSLPLNGFTLLCAAAYAAGTICSQLFFIKAVECGSVALSSLLYAYGFLLPTVYGTLAYHETLRLAQVAGCVLIAGALLLCLGGKKGKFSLRWLVFALLATVSSGGVGIVQKVFRCSPYRDALDSFLILAFALVALASLLLWLTVPRKKSPAAPAGSRRKFFLAALALAGVVCAANKLNLYLSGVFPSVVMFPCVNGGCILLSLLVSRVFFHEVITRRQLAGIFTGVAAIVLISLP